MKLQFEPDLEYQHAAIDAVCDLFTGQETGASLFTVAVPKAGVEAAQGRMFDAPDSGYANALRLPADELLANLRAVQLRNGLRQDDALRSMDFAVEMETGTGKTYVYLRTILELHGRYGWTKFVIVVPSVAIKQGVLKSLEITREHLRGLYDGVAVEHHEYDGSDLSRVRDFAVSRNVRVLVTTVQAIYPDAGRVAYQPNEKTGGDRPIDLIRGTNPIVIIDEPQSVEGGEDGVGARAIAGLNPLAILRYSATHLRKVHEVYRLDAVDAFQRKLVKRIEVAAATARAAHNKPYVRLVGVKTKKGGGPRATLELDVEAAGGGVARREVVLSGNEDLEQTTRREVYRNARLGEVRGGKAAEQAVELRLPGETRWLARGETYGGIDADTFDRMLIERAVAAHLDKELVRRPLGIKVLTLFFVDGVADYREYDEDGAARPGRLARIFEEVYERKKHDPRYATLFGQIEKELAAGAVHDGYFARDARGRLRDTADSFRSVNGRDAKEAFDLIMKDKERLLGLGEPLKFIFSHSALREGWDNPNVFQICSLRAMGTERQRRQTLGRGLRICVDKNGARVRDEDLNVLTVIAGESYADYARRLQTEYEEEGVVFGRIEPHEFARLKDDGGQAVGQEASERLHAGLQGKGYLDAKGQVTDGLRKALKEDKVDVPAGFEGDAAAVVALLRERAGRRLEVADADEKATVRPRRATIESEAFRALWERVRDKTTYRVDFDSRALIEACARALRGQRVERARVVWETGEIEVARSGVEASADAETDPRYVDEVGVPVPDVVGLLQERTGLTRSTVAAVLIEGEVAGQLRRNPQATIKLAGDVIEEQKQAAMVKGIRYERTGKVWEQTLFDKEFTRDLTRLMLADDRCATESVPVDSEVERAFLRELMASKALVKLYAKLPREFKVPTPLGAYQPDWAVLVERDGEDRLYFVVETKGDLLESARRGRENAKIDCGKAHFASLRTAHDPAAEYRQCRTLDELLAGS